jgi:hypothetical protein
VQDISDTVRTVPTRMRLTYAYCHRHSDLWNDIRSVAYPLDDELEQLPYTNEDPADDPDSPSEDPCRNLTIVYITDFFTDGRDFAYYVLGQEDVAAFHAGMHGMQAYGGPLTATPILLDEHHSLQNNRRKVDTTGSPMGPAKWKYLYETARIGWSRLLIDPQKVERIKSRNANMLRTPQEAAARGTNAD